MRGCILTLIALSLVPIAACVRSGGTAPVPVPVPVPVPGPDDVPAVAVETVRRGYFGRDWWGCARAGEALRVVHPDSAQLRAWSIACAARAGEDALPLAEAMLVGEPQGPWGLFARASALIDDPRRGPDEGIAAARAAAGALTHRDMNWLLGRALVVHGSHAEATAFLAGQKVGEATAELLGLELALLVDSSEAGEAAVQALAGRIRGMDPSFVDGWFLPAMWLLEHRRAAEAEPLLARALELSPHSPAIHARWWDAVREGQGRSPDERRAAIDADVTALLRARGDAPAALSAAASVYEDTAPGKTERLRGEIVARFPDSREAEWARIAAIRRLSRVYTEKLGKDGKPDPAAEQALRAALDAFIARPRHPVPVLLAEVYLQRYFLLKADPAASPEMLLAAVQAFAAHERQNLHIFADAATVLAERTRYHAEAEAIVREGQRLAELQARSGGQSDERTRNLRILLLSGLGSVLQAQHRYAEARAALDQAQVLDGGRHAEPAIRRAALAEAEGKLAEAERLLIAARACEFGIEQVTKALKGLFRRRHGSERGFDAYLARIDRSLRAQRQAAVLATRVQAPALLAPFVLPRLAGGEVHSEAMRGRVTVISLWATFCTPCAKEFPALQQLVDAFADTPDVAIVTLNTDPDTTVLPGWLAERGYRFDVLLGAAWSAAAGYRLLPTTLFVDTEGRVAFVKAGATDRLVEEFTWRIEALRRPGRRGVKAARRG